MESRKQENDYSVSQQLTVLASKNAPNYSVSAAAGGTILFLSGVEALMGCGSISNYLALMSGLTFLGMAAHEYGLEKTKTLLVTSSMTLFNTAKSYVSKPSSPEERQQHDNDDSQELHMKKAM